MSIADQITDQKAVQYRLERWGRAFRIFHDDTAEAYARGTVAAGGVSYGNCILADWVKFGGPPPRGRECCGGVDLAENPIEQQTERAVMIVAKSHEHVAYALRARWCGAGRVGVERFELFQALCQHDYKKRSYFEFIQQGHGMVLRLLFPNAVAVAA